MHIEPVLISLTGETLPTSFDMLISDPEEGGRMGVIGSLAIPRLYEEGFVYVGGLEWEWESEAGLGLGRQTISR